MPFSKVVLLHNNYGTVDQIQLLQRVCIRLLLQVITEGYRYEPLLLHACMY